MKKENISINDIENAIQSAGNEFTLAEVMKKLGNRSAALQSRLVRLLDGDERFFNSGNQYITREKFFNGMKFIITPDEWEISQGVLFPGHRFIPFTDPEVFPSEITLSVDGVTAAKKDISLPLGQAFHYHLLLGSEQIFDFFIAENPANAYLAKVKNSAENVTLAVFDMADFYRINDFAFGDALLCQVRDFASGKIECTCLAGNNRSSRQLKTAVAALDKAMVNVCTRFEKYPDIPEQIAWAVYFAQECDTTAFSLDEFLHNTTRVAIDSDGDHAVFVEIPVDPANTDGGIKDMISISGGETGSAAAILRAIGSTYTEVEMESFMLDACYSYLADFDGFFKRFFGAAVFADDAQEAVFYNLLAEKFETLQENYNRNDDEIKAPVRADILEMIENRQEFFDGIAASGGDPEKLDGELLRECAALSLRLDRTLQMLNDPAYTPARAETDALGSAVDTELDRMEEILEILGNNVNK